MAGTFVKKPWYIWWHQLCCPFRDIMSHFKVPQYKIKKPAAQAAGANFSRCNSTNRLRFILPCKSDCQPIFLKTQGIHSLYAKLWLLRPLIKNIPDYSHRYGSNVTFWASLAFQMREEYVFDFFFFENWTLRGVNSGVTQFHAQFTHISRQFWALNRKQQK